MKTSTKITLSTLLLALVVPPVIKGTDVLIFTVPLIALSALYALLSVAWRGNKALIIGIFIPIVVMVLNDGGLKVTSAFSPFLFVIVGLLPFAASAAVTAFSSTFQKMYMTAALVTVAIWCGAYLTHTFASENDPFRVFITVFALLLPVAMWLTIAYTIRCCENA